MALLVEKKQLVAPGELLAKGDYMPGEHTYRQGDEVFSSRIGLADVIGNRVVVVPIKGCYVPHVEDHVVGRIIDIGMSGWPVDIRAPYLAMLPGSETFGRREPRSDLSKILDVGDLVMAKIIAFDRTRDPLLSIKGPGLGRVASGRVLEISPTKIPRLIGKQGSMIAMLKQETGCSIIVGQNGLVLIAGKSPKNESVATEAIYMIEREAHTSGLTDRIHTMIKKELEGEEISTAQAS